MVSLNWTIQKSRSLSGARAGRCTSSASLFSDGSAPVRWILKLNWLPSDWWFGARWFGGLPKRSNPDPNPPRIT